MRTQGLSGNLLLGYRCSTYSPRIPDCTYRTKFASLYPAENITSKDVYDAAVQGDKLAQDIFDFTGNILGEAIADAIAFSSPEAIILFGGLAKSGDYIFKPIQKAIDDNVLNIYKGKAKLLMSELKDSDAAVLGASALGWELRDLK